MINLKTTYKDTAYSNWNAETLLKYTTPSPNADSRPQAAMRRPYIGVLNFKDEKIMFLYFLLCCSASAMVMKTVEKNFVRICSRLTIYFPYIDTPRREEGIEKQIWMAKEERRIVFLLLKRKSSYIIFN